MEGHIPDGLQQTQPAQDLRPHIRLLRKLILSIRRSVSSEGGIAPEWQSPPSSHAQIRPSQAALLSITPAAPYIDPIRGGREKSGLVRNVAVCRTFP
jgi:hypothetical protein